MSSLAVALSGLVAVTGVRPAAATALPGIPGTPVAVGMQRAAALRWSAPADAGSPPLTQYRVEANDGSGWTTTPAVPGVESITAGDYHTCALLDDGTVKCWGTNGAGELGLGDTASRGDGPGEMGANLPAVDLGTGRTAVAITTGSSHTCALLNDATVKCWGNNGFGQLGLGDTAIRGDGPGEMGDALPAVDLGTGRTAVAITAGYNHTCASLDDATLKCWGNNGLGQLGQGDTASRGDGPGEMGDALPAVDLGASRTAVTITAGQNHTCASLDDATLKCWGYNYAGQLGLGDTANRGDGPGEMGDALPAVDLGTGRTAVKITAGHSHTCASLDDGTVKCWGTNGAGELGLGDTAFRGDGPGEMGDALPAVDLGTGRTAVAMTAGSVHTCASLDNATLKCWGYNGNGQLGLGSTAGRGDVPGEMGDALPAVDLGAGRTAVAITAGYAHTCALLDDAAVKCWGSNYAGGLGLGDTANRGDGPGEMGDALPAVALGAGRAAVAITAGGNHTCALLATGTVKCWGANGYGQLGQGDTANRGDGVGEMGDGLPAVDLGTGRTAVAITAGGNHTCALLDDATVKCWGHDIYGQLGLGDSAIRGDGPGEMGDALPAVDLGTGRTAVAITAGFAYTCALLDDATVKCWGHNSSGQLGQGDTAIRGDGPGEMGDALPEVDLGTGRTAVAITAGFAYTCALLDDATLKCWGFNSHGELGQGDAASRGDGPGEMGDALPAVDLGTGRTAVAITAGDDHTCALLDDATLKCWGYNGSGQLGQGDTASRGDGPGEMGDALTAVDLGTGRTAVAITTGSNHTCAALDDTTLKCWGANGYGRLGQGDTASRGDGPGEMGDALPAVDLGASRTAVAITAGQNHTCASLDDATLKCWGYNYAGQLGQGDTANRGDVAGEMGDALTAVDLGTGDTAAAIIAVVRLAPGTYQLRVVAVSSAGESTPSGASAPVVVTGPPGAPSHARAAAVASGSLRVRFWAAASNGSAISSYRAACTSSNGGALRSKTGSASPLTVTHLTTGKRYTCTVRAINSRGAGAWSVPSAAVIVGSPGAPTHIRAVKVAAGSLRVTFRAGATNGRKITSFTAKCESSNGGVTRAKSGAVSPLTVTRLTHGKKYTCTVRATNSRGAGAWSAPSAAITP